LSVPIRPADILQCLVGVYRVPEDTESATDYKDLGARYALAILVPLLAVCLRILLNPLLGSKNVYHTVWAAIVFTAWYCGFWPSILSTFVALLGVWYWLLPKQGVFALASIDVYGMAAFLLFSGLIIAVGESGRRSRARLVVAEREAQRAKTLFETFMNNSPALSYLKRAG
jgi:K+-sensing histidine kinase KdpD